MNDLRPKRPLKKVLSCEGQTAKQMVVIGWQAVLTMVTKTSWGRRRCFWRSEANASCRVLLDFTTIATLLPVNATSRLDRHNMKIISGHEENIRF